MEPMWVEQPESGAIEESYEGSKSFTRIFLAEKGDGRRQIIAHGYVFGQVVIVDGDRLILSRMSVNPHQQAYDLVQLIYSNPDVSQGAAGHSDGKTHKDGDDEFTLETAQEQMTRGEAFSNGYIDSLGGGEENENIPVTVAYVVWKRWLKPKGLQRLDGRNSTAPNTFTQVQDMLNSYVHGTDDWEDKMQINKAVEWSNKLIIRDVTVNPDGNLLLREARLSYHPFWQIP